ncbi:putative DNA binding protein [Halohasta litchfieldiae]|jgi:predicted DNA binding protein|uniref:Predicted DNA binding protein, contains HTH domain n=1 Tax=Halohasta litchfieldiae TaxID=1073996 RepID=A0A1H6XGE4_9EURY|nr:helix-turn-helix domain-containing protein [Halohasta litchfieldiae]ATW89018.1 putative DNA binding protein [Halohasta litchfieldiae]SEJ28188.1 Predicted DNA binding protein, contains HTH domain [Halohasta litchfieldiae]
MALVAEFDIPCEQLPLVSVAAAVPAATVVLTLQFNHGNRPQFLITVTDGSQPAVETALSEAVDVAAYTLIGEAGDTLRYKAEPALSLAEQLGAQIDDLSELEALATEDAIIDRIEVTDNGWTQTGWFANREAFTEFRTFWQQNTGFRLSRLTHEGEPESPGNGLTDRQTEALRTAYELGYFDIPRGASLEDVATELDISASSVSERLRRAQTQLIEETVAPMWPPLPN